MTAFRVTLWAAALAVPLLPFCVSPAVAAHAEAPADAAAPAAAQAPAERFVAEGREAQAGGNAAAADAKFAEAERAARSAGDKRAEAFARNSRALLAIEQDRVSDAINFLRDLPLDKSDPRAHLFRYNLGRMLEKAKDSHAALQAYGEALWYKPDFEQAGDRYYTLLVQGSERSTVDHALWVGEALLQGGQPQLAAKRTIDVLAHWGDRPDATRLLTLLARCYVAGPVGPRQFTATEEKPLAALATRFPGLRRRAQELARAYAERGDAADWDAGFRDWKGDREAAPVMSALLRTVADAYARDGKRDWAVGRYRAAWLVDRGNTDAAVYYAGLLRDHKQELDPQGKRLREFVSALFEEKSRNYSRPITTREDWTNLLRLHTILATIFEPGPPQGVNDPQFYTAEYQWRRAVAVQDELRRIDPSFVESPGPYLRLAAALRRDRPAEAWSYYVTAADKLGAARNKKGASAALAEATQVAAGLTLSDEQRRRFRDTAAVIERLPDPADGQGRVIWLPSEYRQAAVDRSVKEQMIKVSESYEEKKKADPLRVQELEARKKEDLDRLLTTEQREQVNRSRSAGQAAPK